MSNQPRSFVSRFSPQRTKAEDLESILVQRDGLITESVSRIEASVRTPNKHHQLFIGPRGIGKTHLIKLIHHRLSARAEQEKFSDRFRVAWLHEDETATSFLKLLILIYRALAVRHPDEFPEADIKKIYSLKADAAREALGSQLLQHLGARTVVVLMENLDALFKDLPITEQRTWRAFIQNHPVFTTLATAQSLFDGVSDRDEPFFGFFDVRHLDALSVEEATELLSRLAQLHGHAELKEFLATPTGYARVRAIHDLAGGNPRLYIILSDFLTVDGLNDLVRPFEETVDQQLTSYYQERLRYLSAQQREIVQFLCHRSRPTPVKAIAEGLFAAQNTIANQLKCLRDLRYVRSRERGRESYYELTEPLMRLSLQVKETRDHQPLNLIVDFLRIWYDRRELEQQRDAMEFNDESRPYLDTALAKLDSGELNLRHEILRDALHELAPEHYNARSLDLLRCLAAETRHAEDLSNLANVLKTHGDLTGAREALNTIINSPDSDSPILACWLVQRSIIHGLTKHYDAGLDDANRAISLGGMAPELKAVALRVRIMLRRGNGQHDQALDDLLVLTELARNKVPLSKTMDMLPVIGVWLVHSIFQSSTHDVHWLRRISQFLPAFAQLERIPILGEELVWQLPILAASALNHDAYDAWADAWQQAIRDLPMKEQHQMEIPLRLLRAGIAYLKTKDEGSLLALNLEERKILRTALWLPPEAP